MVLDDSYSRLVLHVEECNSTSGYISDNTVLYYVDGMGRVSQCELGKVDFSAKEDFDWVIDLSPEALPGGCSGIIGLSNTNWSSVLTVKFGDIYLAKEEETVYVVTGNYESGNPQLEEVLANPDLNVVDFTAAADVVGEDWHGMANNTNALFIVNDDVLANGKNVLEVGESGAYICRDLELDVSRPFYMPFGFTAEKACALKDVDDARYATMVLPFAVEIPQGVTAYKLTNVEENKVMGEKLDEIPAGQPVLFTAESGDYMFNAMGTSVLEPDMEPGGDGLLTGVYADGYAPAGSYVLQNESEGVAFYAVERDGEQKVRPYTAYLTLPETVAGANRLVIDLGNHDLTGVRSMEAIEAAVSVVGIYDLSGRKVSNPVKGVNLMKMSDGSVRKVTIR